MIHLQRRDALLGGGTVASILLHKRGFALAAQWEGRVIPWLDQPPPLPPPAQKVILNLTPWEQLDSWVTPTESFFSIAHYEVPEIDAATWRLDVLGLVDKPLSLTLADLKARPRQEVTFTIECSGNNGLPFFTSGVGNAQWAGASLADILKAAQITSRGLEVVFFGVDKGEEVVHQGTPGEVKFTGHFARSMSLEEAINPANILCYEMNGEALSAPHGAPLRLIAPGWFGIANVKWLNRIEVRDTRFQGRFMARDYVTVREEQRNGEPLVVETSVGRGLLKSAPAQVTSSDGKFRITGMAWGPTPIAAVQVKIDDADWSPAILTGPADAPFAWRFWQLDWPATPGEHTITSRAIDSAGSMQPAPDDPLIANKKTYWESNGQITRRIRI